MRRFAMSRMHMQNVWKSWKSLILTKIAAKFVKTIDLFKFTYYITSISCMFHSKIVFLKNSSKRLICLHLRHLHQFDEFLNVNWYFLKVITFSPFLSKQRFKDSKMRQFWCFSNTVICSAVLLAILLAYYARTGKLCSDYLRF